MERQTYRHRYKQRPTDWQTDRQTDRQTTEFIAVNCVHTVSFIVFYARRNHKAALIRDGQMDVGGRDIIIM